MAIVAGDSATVIGATLGNLVAAYGVLGLLAAPNTPGLPTINVPLLSEPLLQLARDGHNVTVADTSDLHDNHRILLEGYMYGSE